ncbi:hypothetical protein ACFL2A_04095 [Thermodesulfobacteriota bacterium]
MRLKNKNTIIIFILLTSLSFVFNAHAKPKDDDAMVTVDVSPKTLKVGDEITLNIYIKHDKEFSLYLPDSIDLTPFDIIDTKVKGLKKESGTFSQATFKMSIYKVGIFSIPSINLLLKSANKRVEIKTPQRKIEVLSTLKTGENSLLDVYPPLDIRQSYLKYLIYVWSISFLLIVYTILHFKKKKQKVKVAVTAPKVKEDPTKMAMKLLSKIFMSENLAGLNDKEICENVAFAVKYFIKEKFEIDSLEMTSRELIKFLSGMGIDESYLADLYKLLTSCDLVKFANRPLDRGSDNDDVAMLKDSAYMLLKTA